MSHNWNVGDLTIGHKDMLTNQEEIMWRVLLHTLSRRVLHIRKRKVFSRRLSRTMKSWQPPRNCFTSSLDARVSWSQASSRSNVRVRWTKFCSSCSYPRRLEISLGQTAAESDATFKHLTCTVPRTSYLVPRTSYLIARTAYLVPRTSYRVPRTSYLVPRTSYLVPRASYLVPRTSYLYLGRYLGGTFNFILACDLHTTI